MHGEKNTVLYVGTEYGVFVVYIDASIPQLDHNCQDWKYVINRGEPSENSFVLFAPKKPDVAELGSALYEVYKYHRNPDHPNLHNILVGLPVIVDDTVVAAIRLGGCFFSFQVGVKPSEFEPQLLFHPNAEDSPFICNNPRYNHPKEMVKSPIHYWEMYSIDNTCRQSQSSSNEYNSQAKARKVALEFMYDGLDCLPVGWREDYDQFVDESELSCLKNNLNKGKGNTGVRNQFKKAFQTLQQFHCNGAAEVGRVLCNLTAQELGFCHQPQSQPIIVKVKTRSFMTRIDTLLVYHRSILSTALGGICNVSKLSDKDLQSAPEYTELKATGPDITPTELWDEVQTNPQLAHIVEKLSDGCKNILSEKYASIFTTEIISSKKPEERLMELLTKAAIALPSIEEREAIVKSLWNDVLTISQIVKKLKITALNYSINLSHMDITPEAFNIVLNHMRLIRLHKCGIGPRPQVLDLSHPDWNDDVFDVLRALCINAGLF